MGMRRILFITGPGKTSLENHFDVNEELVQLLRESGKEELLASLEFERADVQYFYTRQRQALGLGHAVLAARAFVGAGAVRRRAWRLDHRPRSSTATSCAGCARCSRKSRRPPSLRSRKCRATRCGITASRSRCGRRASLVELADLVEKPSAADAPSTLAIAARYVLSPAIFHALDATQPGRSAAKSS